MSIVHTTPVLLLLFVVCLASSCKKGQTTKTIIPESMLTLQIESEQGENINPITNDTMGFSGFPGAIGLYQNINDIPFLVIGKNLKKNRKYDCNYIASIQIRNGNAESMFVLAFPSDIKHQTIVIDSYGALNTEFADFKLWITDWCKHAFSKNEIPSVKWSNESEVYRKLINNQK